MAKHDRLQCPVEALGDLLLERPGGDVSERNGPPLRLALIPVTVWPASEASADSLAGNSGAA